MPELPEVETVVSTLKKIVIGKKILLVEVKCELIVKTDLKDFTSKLVNETITDVKRRGKYIVFVLENFYLISHLRMEGKYFYKNENEQLNVHDHIIFHFSDKTMLLYNDVRKFGTMDLIPKSMNYMDYIKIGVEPLSDEFNLMFLKNIKSNKTIKSFLLDQSNVCGLGNIYVDEILFLCKIHPLKKYDSLTDFELSNLITYSKVVLSKAIKSGGTTIYSYESINGISGKFQLLLKVHTKDGQPCERCGTKISKIKVSGRGTYLCEKCQKLL